MGDLLEQLSRVPTGQKVILLFLTVAGIFCGFFFLAYQPAQEEITSLHATVATQDATLSSLPQNNSRVGELQEEIATLCEQQTSFYEQLPPRAEVSDLLQSVYQRAQQVGLEIGTFELGSDEPGEQYATLPVTMEISGTYDQVSDFFFAVSEQRRIINISNISVSVREYDEVTGAAPELSVQCLLRTFYTDPDSNNGGDACQSID